MWPLVILGAAAWYLSRPGRNPQLSFFETLDRPAEPSHELPADVERGAREWRKKKDEKLALYGQWDDAVAAVQPVDTAWREAEKKHAAAQRRYKELVSQLADPSKIERAATTANKLRAAADAVYDEKSRLEGRAVDIDRKIRAIEGWLDKEQDRLYDAAGQTPANHREPWMRARMRSLRAILGHPPLED